MLYSSLVNRLDSAGGAGWEVHFAASQAQERGEDVLILSIGDPNFATPGPIVDAAVSALLAGDTHYTDIIGRPALRELVAERFSRTTGRSWSGSEVMVASGTQGALFATSLCLFEAGDEVIVFDPMYLTYEATLRAGGADLVVVPQDPDEGFRIDADRVAAAVTERTKAIVLTTPNNPTGVVATRDELEALAAVACQHDLWVVADEVYADLVFEGTHVSIASLDEMPGRTVTVNSLSKSHAMTGWRVGWAIAPPELIAHFDRLGLATTYGIPGFVQAAAVEALRSQDEAVREMRCIYQRRRDLVVAELSKAPNLPVLSPQAGMYVMVDVRPLGMTGREFAWALFEATGVAVVDAGAFGSASSGWLRLAFTISDEGLADACRRLVSFVGTL